MFEKKSGRSSKASELFRCRKRKGQIEVNCENKTQCPRNEFGDKENTRDMSQCSRKVRAEENIIVDIQVSELFKT